MEGARTEKCRVVTTSVEAEQSGDVHVVISCCTAVTVGGGNSQLRDAHTGFTGGHDVYRHF